MVEYSHLFWKLGEGKGNMAAISCPIGTFALAMCFFTVIKIMKKEREGKYKLAFSSVRCLCCSQRWRVDVFPAASLLGEIYLVFHS